MQMEQLQEAQASAHSRLSCHKEATQLLQTELQDSRALVQEKESAIEEKESAIQTLRNKLRESEVHRSLTQMNSIEWCEENMWTEISLDQKTNF